MSLSYKTLNLLYMIKLFIKWLMKIFNTKEENPTK
jgi:hypothetical protein